MPSRLISGNLLRVRQDTSSSSSSDTTPATSTTSRPTSSVPSPFLEAAFSLKDGNWARTYIFGYAGAHSVLSGPFAGNMQGTDTRDTIYGTARYGSGYRIGDPDQLDVQNRYFTHGFWPIYWGKDGYGGSYEYSDNIWRPGGFQAVAPVTKGDTQWYIIGDADTVQIMNSILSRNVTEGGCATISYAASIYRFDPDSNSHAAVDLPPNSAGWDGTAYYTYSAWLPTTTPLGISLKPENAVQWYRGSSFALLIPSHTNQAALNNNTAPISTANTALNLTTTASELLKCVNETIGAAIPIFDSEFTVATFETTTPSYISKQGLKPGIIAAIVILSVLGLAVYTVGLLWIGKRISRRRALSLQKKGTYEPVQT